MGSQQVEDSHAINHSLGPMKMQKFRECFKNNTPPPFMFHRATHSHQLLAEVLSYINLVNFGHTQTEQQVTQEWSH